MGGALDNQRPATWIALRRVPAGAFQAYVEGEVLNVEKNEEHDAGESGLEAQHDARQQHHPDDLNDDPGHRVEPGQCHEHQRDQDPAAQPTAVIPATADVDEDIDISAVSVSQSISQSVSQSVS